MLGVTINKIAKVEKMILVLWWSTGNELEFMVVFGIYGGSLDQSKSIPLIISAMNLMFTYLAGDEFFGTRADKGDSSICGHGAV
ncbi:hypothetical protein [Ideonella paludis]|uniref:hypothetical protein n=1 Tax=Ideonella paludis TaxID=1233411 RepID=UPI0036316766